MQSVSNRTAKNRDTRKWNISFQETLKVCFVFINENMTNEFEVKVPAKTSKFRTANIINYRQVR